MPATSLIIESISIYQSNIPLKAPFKISLGILTHARNIIVIIKTKEGIIGTGECSPFATINGETMESCYAVAPLLATALMGMNALDIEACTQRMQQAIYANYSIKSAFDMALYDIAAQHAQLPLYAFLGGTNNKLIQTDYTVSIDAPEKMAEDAAWIKEQGFTVIKVKLGGDPNLDIVRLQSIRERIGLDIPLRIDANQGWTPDSALQVLHSVAELNIQHCEEPIPRWQFMELAKIREASPIPIMADESCCDDHDAERLIHLKSCNLFNIKLGKSGGLFTAEKMLRIAEQHQIVIQLGGFLESRLAFTAATHFVMCSDQIKYFDFDTCLMFEADPVIGGISYHENGRIHLPEQIGLGASFDPSYLTSLEQITI